MKKVIAFVAVTAAVGAGYYYASEQVQQSAQHEIERQLAHVKAQSGISVSYKTLATDLFSQTLTIDDISVTAPDGNQYIEIETLSLIGYQPQTLPDDVEVSISGIKLTEVAKQQLPARTADTVLNASYSLTSSSKLDKHSGNSSIKTHISAADIFAMDLVFDMGQATALYQLSLDMQIAAQSLKAGEQASLQTQLQQQTQMMQAMMALEPQQLSFAIENKGKLAKALDELAGLQQADLAQLQAVYTEQIGLLHAPTALKQGLTTFINQLERFSFSISLPHGTNVMALQKPEVMGMFAQPEELAQYLNLQVTN